MNTHMQIKYVGSSGSVIFVQVGPGPRIPQVQKSRVVASMSRVVGLRVIVAMIATQCVGGLGLVRVCSISVVTAALGVGLGLVRACSVSVIAAP